MGVRLACESGLLGSKTITTGDWEQSSRIAQELFAFGQAKAAGQGLVLVDTKYEMGRDENGEILLIDEIHTLDSSRYWIADSYQLRWTQDFGQVAKIGSCS